jgi:DNA-binding MarR family transcriptional regulator
MSDSQSDQMSSFGFLLNQAARSLRSTVSRDLRVHGLDDDQWIVLRNTFATEKAGRPGATPQEIAKRLNIHIEDIVSAAERLARDGWVTIGVEPGALQSVIKLTDKARRVLPGLLDVSTWTAERALNGFTNEEVREIIGFLKRILSNLGT